MPSCCEDLTTNGLVVTRTDVSQTRATATGGVTRMRFAVPLGGLMSLRLKKTKEGLAFAAPTTLLDDSRAGTLRIGREHSDDVKRNGPLRWENGPRLNERDACQP